MTTILFDVIVCRTLEEWLWSWLNKVCRIMSSTTTAPSRLLLLTIKVILTSAINVYHLPNNEDNVHDVTNDYNDNVVTARFTDNVEACSDHAAASSSATSVRTTHSLNVIILIGGRNAGRVNRRQPIRSTEHLKWDIHPSHRCRRSHRHRH